MHICGGPSIQTRRVGAGGLGHLVGCLQHLHEEGVNGRVPDELEEEQVLQALEANGAQGRQAQQQLGEPAGRNVRVWQTCTPKVRGRERPSRVGGDCLEGTGLMGED